MKIWYIIILLILIGYVGIINTKKVLKDVENQVIRNIVHSILYLICCFSTLSFDNAGILICTTSAAILGSIIGVERKLMDRVCIGNRYRDYGIVSSGVGFLVLIIFFFNRKDIIITSLLIVGFADPMASFIGRNFGSHKFAVWKNRKTLEGSVAFIIVTWIILFFYLSYRNSITPMMLSVITVFAMIMAIIEAITPSFLDNLMLLTVGAILLDTF